MLFFLDIDGVMVPSKAWKAPEFLEDGFPAFSSIAVHTLNSLLTEEDTIILTTSHKSKFTIDEWKSLFERRGIAIVKLKSLPENGLNLTRKDEIITYLSVNVINENYVIIDDDTSLNDLPVFIKKHLVQTVAHIGLTKAHIEAITALKTRGLQPF
jgi:hypothetical protein